MTENHKRWYDFIKALAWEMEGGYDGPEEPLRIAILKKMGFDTESITESMLYLSEHHPFLSCGMLQGGG